jgi:NADH-quinone oxidoreductase subunit A
MNPIATVAYLALFAATAFLFVLAAMLLGRLLRIQAPTPEKLETYECGEAAVGSSYIQFDLRFYVVALVFLIFDVEVSFFFPWAAVFGKSTQLLDPGLQVVDRRGDQTQLSAAAARKLEELGVRAPRAPRPGGTELENSGIIRTAARRVARLAMAEVGLFFAVLMVGFAYVWKRGDLDWVRASGIRGPARDPDASRAPATMRT